MRIKLSFINVAWQPSTGPASSGGGAQLGQCAAKGGLGFKKWERGMLCWRKAGWRSQLGSKKKALWQRAGRSEALPGWARQQCSGVRWVDGRARGQGGWLDTWMRVRKVGAFQATGNRWQVQGRHSASGPAARQAPKRTARHAGRLTGRPSGRRPCKAWRRPHAYALSLVLLRACAIWKAGAMRPPASSSRASQSSSPSEWRAESRPGEASISPGSA